MDEFNDAHRSLREVGVGYSLCPGSLRRRRVDLRATSRSRGDLCLPRRRNVIQKNRHTKIGQCELLWFDTGIGGQSLGRMPDRNAGVVFFSTDAGTTWSSIPQEQFFGTAGGFFDPVTSNRAYLDYGAAGPLVRIATSPRSVTRLGALSCSKVNSSINGLIFDNAGNGLALCFPGDELSGGRLEHTTDGGFRWRTVALGAG